MSKKKEYNSADEKQVQEAQDLEKIALEQYQDDLRTILDTPSGMRFFKKFMEEGHVFHSTFTGNSQTYFLEGKRALALKIFSDICEAAPGKIPEIIIKDKKNE